MFMIDRNLAGCINRSQIGNQTHSADAGVKFLDAQELAAAGVAPDMVRLSINIENVADILADIAQALAASAT